MSRDSRNYGNEYVDFWKMMSKKLIKDFNSETLYRQLTKEITMKQKASKALETVMLEEIVKKMNFDKNVEVMFGRDIECIVFQNRYPFDCDVCYDSEEEAIAETCCVLRKAIGNNKLRKLNMMFEGNSFFYSVFLEEEKRHSAEDMSHKFDACVECRHCKLKTATLTTLLFRRDDMFICGLTGNTCEFERHKNGSCYNGKNFEPIEVEEPLIEKECQKLYNATMKHFVESMEPIAVKKPEPSILNVVEDGRCAYVIDNGGREPTNVYLGEKRYDAVFKEYSNNSSIFGDRYIRIDGSLTNNKILGLTMFKVDSEDHLAFS